MRIRLYRMWLWVAELWCLGRSGRVERVYIHIYEYSLNYFKGLIQSSIVASIMGDTRGLDCSSYVYIYIYIPSPSM